MIEGEVSNLRQNSSEVPNLPNKDLGGMIVGQASNLPNKDPGGMIEGLDFNYPTNSSEVSNLPNKNLGGMIEDEVSKPKVQTLGGLNESIDELVEKRISKQFSNLFNAYTKAFNNMYGRKGSLFIPRFKRKEIITNNYLTTVICYIHRNPIHHGFAKTLIEWPWSSYKLILENNSSVINASEIINWFGSSEQYIAIHQQSLDSLLGGDFD
jgi:hypothetical protein